MQRTSIRTVRCSAAALLVVAGTILTIAAPATAAPATAAPAAERAETRPDAAQSALDRVIRSQHGMPVHRVRPGAAPVAIGGGSGRMAFTAVPVAAADAIAQAVPAMVRRDAPDVFGSVALPVRRTPLDARWRRVAAEAPGQFGGGTARLLAGLRALPVAARAQRINAWVNTQVSFTPERAGRDHWARAGETLRDRRGDCEDYAVAKMQMLRAAGVPGGSMYFVVVYDLVRRQDHAVLVVRTPGSMLLLDSDTDRIADATLRADYRPMLSFSGERAWVHGYERATAPARYAAVGSTTGTPS